MARKSSSELTQENIDFKAFHEVNQFLKGFGAYSYSLENGLFYGREGGYQFAFRPAIMDNAEILEFLGSSFHVAEPVELFKALKDAKSVWFDGKEVTTDVDTKYTLLEPPSKFVEQNFTIVKYTDGEQEADLELDGSGNLYYEDVLIAKGGFNTNDIVNAISDRSAKNGHTLPFMQIDGQNVIIVGNKTLIDQSKPFLLLDSHIIKKVKLLKNDSAFFHLSFYNDFGTAIIGYGKDKEYIFLCVNGIFKL